MADNDLAESEINFRKNVFEFGISTGESNQRSQSIDAPDKELKLKEIRQRQNALIRTCYYCWTGLLWTDQDR